MWNIQWLSCHLVVGVVCISIFVFNMLIGLTHVLAIKREAWAHPHLSPPRSHSQTAVDEREAKFNTLHKVYIG